MSDVLEELKAELKFWKTAADPNKLSDKLRVQELAHSVSCVSSAAPEAVERINQVLAKSDALIASLQEEIELIKMLRVEELARVVSLVSNADPKAVEQINQSLAKSDALIAALQEEIELRKRQRLWIRQQLLKKLKGSKT
jgi:hypothetical protein